MANVAFTEWEGRRLKAAGWWGTNAATSYLDPVPVRDQKKGAPFPKRRHSGSLGLNLSARFGTDPPNSSRATHIRPKFSQPV